MHWRFFDGPHWEVLLLKAIIPFHKSCLNFKSAIISIVIYIYNFSYCNNVMSHKERLSFSKIKHSIAKGH